MSNIAERVQKLLKSAESFAKEGNQAAADTYNAKAQRLILENEIDEASLLAAGKEKFEEITFKRYEHKGSHTSGWAYLTFFVAHSLGLKTITTNIAGNHKYVTIYGYESDLKTFDLLLASLTLQETNAVWADWKAQRKLAWRTDQTAANRFKKAHILAFALRVGNRIADLKREINKEKVVPGSSTDLVLVDKNAKVEAFFRAANPKTRKGRSVSVKDRNGYEAGTRAGNRADIGQGRVSNNSRRALV